jgi:hypothetical protein
MDFKSLPRRQIRYYCFRLRTEVEGGAKAEPLPEGFKEHFEKQEVFYGWRAFGASWDVSKVDPLKAVSRQFTIHEEWNATLRRVTPVAPGFEHMGGGAGDGS